MGAPLIFRDTFARANSTGLGYGSWTQYGTLWNVTGYLANVAAVGAIAAYGGQVPADCTVKAIEQAVPATGLVGVGAWGVILRASGLSGGSPTYYEAQVQASGTQVKLLKVISGTPTTLATYTITRAVGALLQLDAVGGVLQTWYNGVLLGTVTDSSIAGSLSSIAAGVICDSASAVYLSDVDVCGDTVWTWGVQGYTFYDEDFTEIMDYDSGYEQANSIWEQYRASLSLDHKYLSDTDKTNMLNLWRQVKGRAIPVLVQDPRVPNPNGEVFAIADGVSTSYKVRADKVATVTTFTNGVQDASQPAVSLMTGAIFYSVAPIAGAILSANVTGAYYRARIVAKPEFMAHPPTWWSTKVGFRQVKLIEMGVAP
jgi:hypothetical protein